LAGESFDEFREGGVGDDVEVVSALPDGDQNFGDGDVGLEVGVQAPGDAGQRLRPESDRSNVSAAVIQSRAVPWLG
jgi:hypothetical protein